MIGFEGRVAIVTGAGAGIGRCHALGLAARGAKVIVNDFNDPDTVVAEIRDAGGQAMSCHADVSDVAAVNATMQRAVAEWGRIDIVVNNAGILRDKTFAKMPLEDMRLVLDVHLIGSVNVTNSAWQHMREQGYGRVLFTSSSSGLYGNFGQANYGAAKAAMVGLMNVLHLEGERYDIRVNCLAPTATTQMTADLLSPEAAEVLAPETITPGVLWLVSEDAPSKMIMGAGGGSFTEIRITETRGITLPLDALTPEAVAAAAAAIRNPEGAAPVHSAFEQTNTFAERAIAMRAARSKTA
ncbi:SDR family NAD(P)-dependent oxidoreductase [Acuticoccus sp. I52.16.1]|uniref:SDR family NAD(P)-dependent oxidoreductase n=1 Tax=Acuticoccus sp. I52.16.1 TaxID=2928472 RepID=UPI001FD4684F|nr:SDR family NAD(P)-dependent oxidoreductase [Acuticoccus sp. I52.16.1]UOM33026.1 SDR family NAD(P)-dependent oxidoreductase [Acuticoccus sp. I52.16.1]